MAGLFVTFEGGEGSGKSTQIQRLAARLRAAGREPVITREPGGTPLAEGIRELLLDPARSPNPVTEALLMEAARADLVESVISPALASGGVVLSDRYDDSTLAYQGGGRGLGLEWLRQLNAFATGGLVPDLTLLFDLPVEIGLARRRAQGDGNRLDLEGPEFHGRVLETYRALARLDPERFVVLDARSDPDELEAQAWAALDLRLR